MLSTIQRPARRSLVQLSRSLSTTTAPPSDAFGNARAFLGTKGRAPLPPPPQATATSSTPVSSKAVAPGEPAFYEIPPERDPVLQFLTTSVMKHGRYSRAHKMISEMLLHIHTLTRAPPLPIVHEAIRKASPAVRVKSTKIGARSIVRPVALSERQRTGQGIRWIIEASHNKPGIEMQKRLAKEMIAVIRGDSAALEKKTQLHRAAMISRGSLTSR